VVSAQRVRTSLREAYVVSANDRTRDAGNNGTRQHRYGAQFPELPWWRGGTGMVVSVAGASCRCSRAAGQSRRAGNARPARHPRPAPAAELRKRAASGGRRRPGTPGPARPAARHRRPRSTAGAMNLPHRPRIHPGHRNLRLRALTRMAAHGSQGRYPLDPQHDRHPGQTGPAQGRQARAAH